MITSTFFIQQYKKPLIVAVNLVIIISVLVFLSLLSVVLSLKDGNAQLPADCALVFGAAVHGKESIGPGIARRVHAATQLYNSGKVGHIFVSGGKGSEYQLSEAVVMRRFAIDSGMPVSSISIEDTATSTVENIRNSKPLMEEYGCTSVVGVSDRYHMARIQYFANQEEWSNFSVYPAKSAPVSLFRVRSTVREVIALMYYIFLAKY